AEEALVAQEEDIDMYGDKEAEEALAELENGPLEPRSSATAEQRTNPPASAAIPEAVAATLSRHFTPSDLLPFVRQSSNLSDSTEAHVAAAALVLVEQGHLYRVKHVSSPLTPYFGVISVRGHVMPAILAIMRAPPQIIVPDAEDLLR